MRLIDADAVIDALTKLRIEKMQEGKDVSLVWECLDKVMQVPTAQPDQRWIPCSERLPEKEGLYLVSGDSEIWICRFICLRFFRGWSNPANCPVVKAWMPLPEPYDPLTGHMNPPEDET